MSYALSGVSSADVVGSQLIGTTTVDATGRAVVAVTLAADALTEGAETLTLTAAGKTASVTVNDTSTTPAPVVPPVAPVASYALAAGSTTVNEGAGVNFVLTTKNVPSGSTISYTIGGEVKSDDIVGGSLVGTTTVGVDGVAVFNIGLVNDLRTDGDENMTVTVGGQTVTVKVLDTSKTPPAQPTNIPLTVGPDTQGSATAPAQQNFVGTIVDSLSPFDNLTGATGGTDTLTANISGITLPAAITLTNIPTISLTTSGAGFTADFTTAALSGVRSLTVSDSNTAGGTNVNLTVPTTTNVIASNSGGNGGTMTIVGGNSVSTTQSGTNPGALSIRGEVGAVTVNDAQFGNTITVVGGTSIGITATSQTASTATITVGGNTTAAPAPTGAVTINASSAFVDNTSTTMGAITVTGGTTVSVTETVGQLSSVTPSGAGTFTSGAVNVTGSALTTAVTVNQTAAVRASTTTTTANPGTTAVTAIAAATGVQAVVGVTGATFAAAATPNSGVVGGAVTIADAGNLQTSAGTISTVTLNNYGNSTIASNALTTLNLGGTSGTLSLTNTNTAQIAARANTLAVNFNGATGLSLSGNITAGTSATTNAITDVNNEISTINFNTGTVSSTITGIVDSSLTTINVTSSGVSSTGASTSRLTLSTTPASLTSLNVTGTAGFSDGASSAVTGSGLSTLGAALTIVDSSSGVFNAALNDTTQTFTNTGSGANTIIVSSLQNATRTITAGSGTTDELRLEGGAYALTSASAGRFVGFETLGVAANVTGTIDVSAILPGISRLSLPGAATTLTFTRVPTNAGITIAGSGDTVSVGYIDSTGSADVIPVTLSGVGVTSLTLADANSVGVGTLNLTSNISSTQASTTAVNTITTLVDNGLSTLNVSGTSGLVITTLNEASTPSTSFTLNNTSASSRGTTITTLTDTALNTLTFAGSGNSAITNLNTSSPTLTVANTGSTLQTIGTLTDNSLTSLTLGANVMLGNAATLNSALGLQSNNSTGITINGSADNAHVTVNLAGAASGRTDSITLGNGNNYVLDTSTAGTVTVTVGAGANYIQLGSANSNTTGTYTVNLGSRSNTLWNQVMVGTGGTNFASAPNYIITGANNGDAIGFLADTNSSSTLTTVSLASATTMAAAIALLTGTSGINGVAGRVATGVFGGNTLVAESASGTTSAGDTTVIQINGTPTLTAGSGGITIGTIAASPFASASSANTFTVIPTAANSPSPVTLAAGANTVNYSALVTAGTHTGNFTSVAGTTALTINDASQGAGVLHTIQLTGSTGTANASSDVATLTVNNVTTGNAIPNTVAAFTDNNLQTVSFNNSGAVAAALTATGITSSALSTVNIGGGVNGVADTTTITIIDSFAGAVTYNDTSRSTGLATITATTLGASSLAVNLAAQGTGTGGLAVTAFGDAALTSMNLSNTSNTASTLAVGNVTSSALSNLTITGANTAANIVTVGTVASTATSLTINDTNATTGGADAIGVITAPNLTSLTINYSAPAAGHTMTLGVPVLAALTTLNVTNTGGAAFDFANGNRTYALVGTTGANSATFAGSSSINVGVAALTITSANTSGNFTLTDSMSVPLTIAAVTEAADTTGNITITNSGSSNLTITTLTGTAAATGTVSINNTGSGGISIPTGTTVGGATLNVNAAGGAILLGTFADNTATTIALTGQVGMTAFTDSVATAVTITQTGTNNQAVSIGLTGAGAVADSVRLGNGNNTFSTVHTGATTVTVGTGVNSITVPGTAATTINLGTHTAADTVTLGGAAVATAAGLGVTTINGWVAADILQLSLGHYTGTNTIYADRAAAAATVAAETAINPAVVVTYATGALAAAAADVFNLGATTYANAAAVQAFVRANPFTFGTGTIAAGGGSFVLEYANSTDGLVHIAFATVAAAATTLAAATVQDIAIIGVATTALVPNFVFVA